MQLLLRCLGVVTLSVCALALLWSLIAFCEMQKTFIIIVIIIAPEWTLSLSWLSAHWLLANTVNILRTIYTQFIYFCTHSCWENLRYEWKVLWHYMALHKKPSRISKQQSSPDQCKAYFKIHFGLLRHTALIQNINKKRWNDSTY